MNQQTLPASPSLPADLLTLHHKNARGVSEVQAKVAFLNGLSRGASPGGSAANNAAIQRAILGREEAESALATAQEELSEAESRERRISERLESLLEELHGTKERQGHERSIFEKEIRKARKEAFRAGSTLVKLQEELKHSKSEVKALKDEVSAERESKEKAKQEAFERAYALAGLTEEFEVLKGKLRSLETDNHSSNLEVRAHEIRREDFGRMSLAEGDLAFLTTPRRPKRAAAGSIRSPALLSARVCPTLHL
jgi:chromosome segregation ATPase